MVGATGAGGPGAGAVGAGTPAATASDAGGGEKPDKDKGQPNKSRCFNCKKKVGLTGFECRCGFVFCGAHRYPDQHACTFDFKSHDKAILEKLNPKVVGKKVDTI